MNKLEILEQEVSKITNEIIKHNEEIEKLDIIREVLQQEIDLNKPINTFDELPF